MKNVINKEGNIILIGNKFVAYIYGLFLRYNLNNFGIDKRIDIYPVDVDDNYGKNQFLNNFPQEHIIKPDFHNNAHIHLFHELIDINKLHITYPDKHSINLFSYYFSKGGDQLNLPNYLSMDDDKLINEKFEFSKYALRMKLFQLKLFYDKSSLKKCYNENLSANEFLNLLNANKEYRCMLEKYLYFTEGIEDLNLCDGRYFISLFKRKIERYPLEKLSDNIKKYPRGFLRINLSYREFLDKMEISLDKNQIKFNNKISDSLLKDRYNTKILIGNYSDFVNFSEIYNEIEEIKKFLIENKLVNISVKSNNLNYFPNYRNFIYNLKCAVYNNRIFNKENCNINIQVSELSKVKNLLKILNLEDILHSNSDSYVKSYITTKIGYTDYISKLNLKYNTFKTHFFFTDIYLNKYENLILEAELESRKLVLDSLHLF